MLAEGARPAAGMTALALAWHAAPPADDFCDISGIAALSGIAETAEGLRLGALTTLEEMRRAAPLRAHWPALVALLAGVGSLGVRAQATLGGNLGWTAGDLAPVLLAAGARIEGEDGLVEAVLLPRDGSRLLAEKIGHRAAFSPTLVTVAAGFRLEEGRLSGLRLAVGGGPTAPQRLPRAEAALEGANPAALDWRATGRDLAQEIAAGEDELASAAHRARVAGRALAHALACLA